MASEESSLLINHGKNPRRDPRTQTSTTTTAVGGHYPYKPLAFILTSTVLQSSFNGVQSILELFFSRFVFICSNAANTYGTVAVNVFIAANQLSALMGGIMADHLLGNFHTQNFSNMLATVGILIVVFFTWQYMPSCCQSSMINNSSSCLPVSCLNDFHQERVISSWSVSPWIPSYVSIVMIAMGCVLFSIGNGHLSATQSVFVGDQFPEGRSSEKEKSFSWYFLFQTIGNLFCDSCVPIMRQSVGFMVSFTVIAGAYTLSTGIFMMGWFWYSHSQSERKRLLMACHGHKKSLPSTTVVETQAGNTNVKWSEIWSLLGVCAPMIAFWALFFQQNSTWVLQGAMMDCYIGKLHLPPDMMPSINDLMVIVLIPTLDYIVYPHLKSSMNLHIKPLQKIMAGMVCVALSFLFAALLQLYIPGPPLVSCRGEVSIMWQIPQLLLVSLAEVLVSVTSLEFTYSQPPPRFRNTYNGVWCITLGLGAALNALIALIDLSLLYLFLLYATLMFITVFIFMIINWNYKYK